MVFDQRRSPCLCPLRITRLSVTRRRRRWLAAMGRSTGCAYRGSTPERSSLLSLAQRNTVGVAPASPIRATRRRYRGDTMVLETEFDTDEGTVRLIDFMPIRGEAMDVVRIVEGV